MIDRRLIFSIVTSAAVIVVGTLCVFYAEVSFTDWTNMNGQDFPIDRCAMEKSLLETRR